MSTKDIIRFDDIEIKESNGKTLATCHHIRQQVAKTQIPIMTSLADFVAPKGENIDDYIGGFVVTAGIGAEALASSYEAQGDDYSAIMVKALADRLAEAFAEYLHEKVRKDYWGYDREEALSNEALIQERYRGIRPAPGYPACPDHSEKKTLFSLLNAEQKIGVTLTEHYAMFPTAAVSGWYFSHPNSKYFNVGKIGLDQVESLAKRKGVSVEEVERWLQPNLDYEPPQ